MVLPVLFLVGCQTVEAPDESETEMEYETQEIEEPTEEELQEAYENYGYSDEQVAMLEQGLEEATQFQSGSFSIIDNLEDFEYDRENNTFIAEVSTETELDEEYIREIAHGYVEMLVEGPQGSDSLSYSVEFSYTNSDGELLKHVSFDEETNEYDGEDGPAI